MLDQGILFIILAFIILGIYLLYPNVITQEGFTVNITDGADKVEIAEIENKKIDGYEKISELPTANFEGATSNAPSSYRDLRIKNANSNQLLELNENIKAFLTFEAPNLQDKSDPQIQLPLSTARGDLRRLESEAAVLSRNPGIRSTLTNEQLLEMEANIDFLRKQARSIIGPSYVPSYVPKNSIEGFADAKGMTYPSARNSGHEGFMGVFDSHYPRPGSLNQAEGFTNATEPSTASTTNEKASFKDVENAYSRLMAKKTYLIGLNVNDPEMANKITKINQIIQELNTIITKINTNQMKESEIIITKKELDTMYNTHQLNSAGEEVPAWLSNLLPSGLNEDPKLRTETSDLLQNYMTNLPKGLSWNVNVGLNYTSENATKAGESNSIYNKTYGSATNQATNQTTNQQTQMNDIFPNANQLNQLSSSSEFQPNGNQLGDPFDPYTNFPQLEGRPPTVGSFDWKERAKSIENAVIKRGLNPNDFGIMPKGSEVSETFGWKGYAKMICTRLMATPDTGLPESCGCPPLNWPGWK